MVQMVTVHVNKVKVVVYSDEGKAIPAQIMPLFNRQGDLVMDIYRVSTSLVERRSSARFLLRTQASFALHVHSEAGKYSKQHGDGSSAELQVI